MNQYVKITSGNIGLHQPQVEPWHQRSEREMLNRSRPGPSGAEQAIERSLLDQVAGKSIPEAKTSPQFQRDYASRQPSRRELDLELRLFEQVRASGFQPIEP